VLYTCAKFGEDRLRNGGTRRRFRFCMGPYGNAIYKERQENTISGVG